jgi:MazG family protein
MPSDAIRERYLMSESFDELKELVAYLRSEKGCAWDREQTTDSLRPHILEEAHEVCEAIEEGEPESLREEVGDLLFLLLFIVRIAEENGRFTVEEVIRGSLNKMRARHPHVFGEQKKMSPGEVLDQWEKRKRAEKAEGESVLSGVPKTLSALNRAQRIQQRAASLGFDWDDVQDTYAKLKEEMDEFEEAWRENDPVKLEEELGDILFSLVNVSRFLGIRAEDALQGTISKFMERFAEVEREIEKRGRMTLSEMDAVWERSKRRKGDSGS